jgi:hypothetical protein
VSKGATDRKAEVDTATLRHVATLTDTMSERIALRSWFLWMVTTARS